MIADQATEHHCSFCGKSQHEVNKLIAGPSVYICNECVTLCVDILAGDEGFAPSKNEAAILKEAGTKRLLAQVVEILDAEKEVRQAALSRYEKLEECLQNLCESEDASEPSIVSFSKPATTE